MIDEFIVILLAGVFSGLVATFVAIWYEGYKVEQMRKFDLTRRLFISRAEVGSPNFNTAINEIPATFNNHPEVLEYWQTITKNMSRHKSIDARDLINLMRAMMDVANISHSKLNDEEFLRGFTHRDEE